MKNARQSVRTRAARCKNNSRIQILTFLIRFSILLSDDNILYKWYHSFTDQSKENTFNLPFVPQYDRAYTGNFDNWTLSLNATNPGLDNET